MADYTIEREVVIDAPIDVVWRTVTEPDQISQWFADRVELDVVPGGRGTFVFENHGQPVTAPLVIETVDRPTRFAFRWSQPDGEEPGPSNSMLVTFTLVPEAEERTRLRVVETGLELLSWAEEKKVHYAEDHNGGWVHHTDRIVALLAGRRSVP